MRGIPKSATPASPLPVRADEFRQSLLGAPVDARGRFDEEAEVDEDPGVVGDPGGWLVEHGGEHRDGTVPAADREKKANRGPDRVWIGTLVVCSGEPF